MVWTLTIKCLLPGKIKKIIFYVNLNMFLYVYFYHFKSNYVFNNFLVYWHHILCVGYSRIVKEVGSNFSSQSEAIGMLRY